MHRITLSLLALVLFGTIGLGYSLTSFYNLLRKPSDQAVDSYAYAKTLGEQLAKTLDAVSDRQAFIDRWNEQNDFPIDIIESAQFAISGSFLRELRQNGPLALEDEKGIRFNFYLNESDEVLVVRAPASATDGQAGLRLAFTAFFYVGLLILTLVWLAPLLYRLKKLRTAAVSFGKGQLDTRIYQSNTSYISDIETEFNRMADQIENLVDDVRLLSSALSHEMRTPLAKLRMGIDTLEEQNDPVTRRSYHERLSRTVDQLTQLVGATLEFSRMDFILMQADRCSVDLVPIIHTCIDKSTSVDVDIHFDSALDSCCIRGSEPYLSLMMTNLMENAAKYGRGRVVIRLVRSKSSVSLSIEDDGPGFDEGASEYVFKPFQRGKAERAKSGFGLGLAVVDRIVSWHGGKITVDRSAELIGACITISFEAD